MKLVTAILALFGILGNKNSTAAEIQALKALNKMLNNGSLSVTETKGDTTAVLCEATGT